MKSRDRVTVSLSACALALALAFSPAHATQAQDATQNAVPGSTQTAAPEGTAKAEATTTVAKPFYRKTQVGSNIARVRNDESLPVSRRQQYIVREIGREAMNGAAAA